MPDPNFKKFLEETTSRYMSALKGSGGEAYLASRGLRPEAIAYFRLGLVSAPPPEHRQYGGMLSIPYVTKGGIVTCRFRRLTGQGPKYLSLEGAAGESRPFNVRTLQLNSPRIFVCEGEIDTMTVAQLGVSAIGFPGANSWKPTYRRMLRYRSVTVLADNDDTGAGMEFARKIAADVQGCHVIKMPSGYDVNSFYTAEGEDELRKLIGA